MGFVYHSSSADTTPTHRRKRDTSMSNVQTQRAERQQRDTLRKCFGVLRSMDSGTLIENILRAADGKRRRTDPRPYAEVGRCVAGKRKALATRNAGKHAVLEQERKARKARRRSAPGQGIADKILQVMQPGEWYGAGDLVRAVGAGRDARCKLGQVLLPRRRVERARNPAWSTAPINPWRIMAGEVREPKWLYRLTGTTVSEAAR
jgi:hypothetical protein